MSLVEEGNIVPLVAQASCIDDKIIYVRAYVINKENNLLDTLDLVDHGNGSFDYYGYLYPEFEELIKVKYQAFKDDLYTIPSDDLCEASEVFTVLKTAVTDIGINRINVFNAEFKKEKMLEVGIDKNDYVVSTEKATYQAYFYQDELDYFLDNGEYIGEVQ